MEGWIIILAIALLRGLGGWMRRRQQQQEGNGTPGKGQRRPEPGDPDAFDLEDLDPFADDDWDWGSSEPQREPQRPTQSAPQPSPAGHPYEPSRQSGSPTTAPVPAGTPTASTSVLTQADRQRQELMERLSRAASEVAEGSETRPLTPVSSRARPQADEGVRIAHTAGRASDLRHMLQSPQRIREALVLREVLGPPVALRGPLRAGHQPR